MEALLKNVKAADSGLISEDGERPDAGIAGAGMDGAESD